MFGVPRKMSLVLGASKQTSQLFVISLTPGNCPTKWSLKKIQTQTLANPQFLTSCSKMAFTLLPVSSVLIWGSYFALRGKMFLFVHKTGKNSTYLCYMDNLLISHLLCRVYLHQKQKVPFWFSGSNLTVLSENPKY